MLIQPRPKPVITITSAPITAWGGPLGTAETAAQSTSSTVMATYATVTAPVIQVSTDCSRMMTW